MRQILLIGDYMEYKQLTFKDISIEPEHFGNRKDLLDSLSLYGAALFLASCITEMDAERLCSAAYWYEYLNVEVDDEGEKLK